MRRVDAAEKLRGDARYVGDMSVPRMLHGKVLRSPVAHARIVSIDAVGGARHAGRGRGAHRATTCWTSTPTGGTPSRTDPSWPSTGCASRASRWPRSQRRTRPSPRRRSPPSWWSTTELPVVGTIDEALAPDAPPSSTTVPLRPGLFHGLGTLPERDGNICYRYGFSPGRRGRRCSRSADIVVEGDYTVPGRLPVRDGDAQRHRPVGGGRRSRCGRPASTRSWCGRRSPSLFDLPLGTVRVIVPYLGGGFGSKSYTKMEPITVALARKAGRPVRIVNSVDESMVTTRRHGCPASGCGPPPTATGGCWRATSRRLVRHRRLRRQRPARDRHRRRRRARALSLGRGPGRRLVRLHQHRARPVPTAPSAPRTSSGWASCRSTRSRAAAGSTPLEIRRRNLLRPGEQVRPGGKPLDADLIGDIEKVAAALGWDDPKPADTGRGLSRRPARRRRPPGLDRRRAHGGGRRGDRARRLHRGRPGPADRVRPDRGRGAGHARRAGALHRRRTPASRPTTVPPAPAARRRSPGSPCSGPRRRCAPTCSTSRRASGPGARRDIEPGRGHRRGAATSGGPTRSSSPGASGWSAASSSARAACTRRDRAPTPRGRSSGRSASAPRRSRSTARRAASR